MVHGSSEVPWIFAPFAAKVMAELVAGDRGEILLEEREAKSA